MNENIYIGYKKPILPKLEQCIKKSKKMYFVVSFIRDSGIKLLIKLIEEAVDEGKEVKIITSNYMNITEPNALYRLKNIFEERENVKIFDNPNISFHPKTYIFEYEDGGGEILIGSSNLSYSALVDGVEWNYAFSKKNNIEEYEGFLNEFNELYENNSFNMTLEWLRKYEKSYKVNKEVIDEKPINISMDIEPIKFQIPALYELSKTREEGYKKAMVIVATGLGKTYLGAFDTLNYNKILFVAHSIEILEQGMKTFKTIHTGKKAGFFIGDKKDVSEDIIFASIQTLGKEKYLNDTFFKKNHFDYIIIDEFHHAEAPTYRRLIKYFEPQFLLGLTATPDRADNGDIYELCDYNIAYECNFKTGINNGWLVPFEYFGIYDKINYENIPWRSGKYDIESLENELLVESRSKDIFSKYLIYSKGKTIGFCASVKHAKYMKRKFKEYGVESEVVLGETSKKDRTNIIENFKKGQNKLIFVVDIFNEGIDIPDIETVMFLRPTTSYTIFIQQLGRGLRTSPNKEKLKILDFVGNYKGSEWRASFLSGDYNSKDPNYKAISVKDIKLPENCNVKFDFELIDYLERQREAKEPLKEKLKSEFLRVKDVLNEQPTIMDMEVHSKYPVNIYIKSYKSWLNFLIESENGNKEDEKLYNEKVSNDFLSFIEKTKMTKSYKIPTLLSFMCNGTVKEVSSIEMGRIFYEFYSNDVHVKDLSNKKHKKWKDYEYSDFEKLAVDNPIKFLSKSNDEFFKYDKNKKLFSINLELYKLLLENEKFKKEVEIRIEYRKVSYFKRKYGEV